MLFSSIEFIFRFLPIFFVCYFLTPGRWKNVVLLVGSLIFYAIGESLFVLLMLGLIAVNYGAAVGIAHAKKKRQSERQQFFLVGALVIDLGTLFLFKYFDFFAENVNLLLHHELVPLLGLTLPLGISFYTFQIISYVADVSMGTVEDPGTFLEFATYLSMFPQLIAGPIVQYREVAAQLRKRRVTLPMLEQGLEVFCLGLGAKVLLANKISIFWNQVQGIGFSSISTPIAWMGAFAFSFEIYFDFWGYSLMAMGLGMMMGFRIPRNFTVPYMACSATEFWRRWHITLGRFFREYVYIPLGGNRKGRWRTILNLFIVWALTGLWHGASWNFVLWGLGFFVLLTAEKNLYGEFLDQHTWLGHLYMWIIIPVSWMVFEITDLKQLLIYLGQLVGIHADKVLVGTDQLLRYLQQYGWLFAVCALCATWLPVRLYRRFRRQPLTVLVCLGIFWFSVYEIYQGAANPFLYFRF